MVVAAKDLGRRAALPGATRSCRTAPAAARRSPRTRSRRATTTSRTPPCTSACPVREPAAPLEPGDQLLVWTTTPWTLISNAAVAVGPEIEYVAGPPAGSTRSSSWPRPLVERVLGEGAEVVDRFPGERPGRHRVRAALRLHHRLRAARAHRARGRLRHHRRGHRPGPHRDRLRRGRLPARRAVRDHPPKPGAAGRHLRRADHRFRRALRQGGRRRHHRGAAASAAAAARRDLRARLSALLALRHAAPLLREVELVHPHHRGPRPDARRERDDRLASRAHQARAVRQVAGGKRGLGAVTRALLGHAAADLGVHAAELRRSASAPARSPTCASGAATSPRTSTARTSTRSSCAARRAAARCAGCRR